METIEANRFYYAKRKKAQQDALARKSSKTNSKRRVAQADVAIVEINAFPVHDSFERVRTKHFGKLKDLAKGEQRMVRRLLAQDRPLESLGKGKALTTMRCMMSANFGVANSALYGESGYTVDKCGHKRAKHRAFLRFIYSILMSGSVRVFVDQHWDIIRSIPQNASRDSIRIVLNGIGLAWGRGGLLVPCRKMDRSLSVRVSNFRTMIMNDGKAIGVLGSTRKYAFGVVYVNYLCAYWYYESLYGGNKAKKDAFTLKGRLKAARASAFDSFGRDIRYFDQGVWDEYRPTIERTKIEPVVIPAMVSSIPRNSMKPFAWGLNGNNGSATNTDDVRNLLFHTGKILFYLSSGGDTTLVLAPRKEWKWTPYDIYAVYSLRHGNMPWYVVAFKATMEEISKRFNFMVLVSLYADLSWFPFQGFLRWFCWHAKTIDICICEFMPCWNSGNLFYIYMRIFTAVLHFWFRSLPFLQGCIAHTCYNLLVFSLSETTVSTFVGQKEVSENELDGIVDKHIVNLPLSDTERMLSIINFVGHPILPFPHKVVEGRVCFLNGTHGEWTNGDDLSALNRTPVPTVVGAMEAFDPDVPFQAPTVETLAVHDRVVGEVRREHLVGAGRRGVNRYNGRRPAVPTYGRGTGGNQRQAQPIRHPLLLMPPAPPVQQAVVPVGMPVVALGPPAPPAMPNAPAQPAAPAPPVVPGTFTQAPQLNFSYFVDVDSGLPFPVTQVPESYLAQVDGNGVILPDSSLSFLYRAQFLSSVVTCALGVWVIRALKKVAANMLSPAVPAWTGMFRRHDIIGNRSSPKVGLSASFYCGLATLPMWLFFLKKLYSWGGPFHSKRILMIRYRQTPVAAVLAPLPDERIAPDRGVNMLNHPAQVNYEQDVCELGVSLIQPSAYTLVSILWRNEIPRVIRRGSFDFRVANDAYRRHAGNVLEEMSYTRTLMSKNRYTNTSENSSSETTQAEWYVRARKLHHVCRDHEAICSLNGDWSLTARSYSMDTPWAIFRLL